MRFGLECEAQSATATVDSHLFYLPAGARQPADQPVPGHGKPRTPAAGHRGRAEHDGPVSRADPRPEAATGAVLRLGVRAREAEHHHPGRSGPGFCLPARGRGARHRVRQLRPRAAAEPAGTGGSVRAHLAREEQPPRSDRAGCAGRRKAERSRTAGRGHHHAGPAGFPPCRGRAARPVAKRAARGPNSRQPKQGAGVCVAV